MNAFSAIGLIIFLSLVLTNGKNKELAVLLSKEGGFVKWGISLAVIISASKHFGKMGDSFLTILYVAMVLMAYRKNNEIFNQLAAELTA